MCLQPSALARALATLNKCLIIFIYRFDFLNPNLARYTYIVSTLVPHSFAISCGVLRSIIYLLPSHVLFVYSLAENEVIVNTLLSMMNYVMPYGYGICNIIIVNTNIIVNIDKLNCSLFSKFSFIIFIPRSRLVWVLFTNF